MAAEAGGEKITTGGGSACCMQRMAPANPFNAEEVAYYTAHSEGHPLVGHYERTGETRARRVSDVIGHRTWLASPHYRHCLARLGHKYSVALP